MCEKPQAAGEPWCVDLDGVVAPFTLDPAAPPTCTVERGTKIFVAAVTIECSTVEEPPFFGSNEAELRECARAVDVPGSTLTLTVDGEPVPLTLVETPLLTIDLPEDNILGVDRKSTRLNSSHANISYAVFCLKKKNQNRLH